MDPRKDVNDNDEPPPDNIDVEMDVDNDELLLEELEEDFINDPKEKEISTISSYYTMRTMTMMKKWC